FFYKKDRDHYLKNKEKARSFIEQKVIEFCAFYNFSVPKISIKNQGTRWGSCSSKGNINFNYKILFMPKEMSDYIIVHELCHLKELNHSKNFWNLVAKFIPDYQKIRQDLKRISELSLNNQSFLVDTK
ncbi:MAG: M48 family metallopeptidase, partial [Planctomycetes bacterium]|nr:M48 family metallopeptidase [Planctomycetota bacterium]